jgi:hypothetical protein
LSGRACYLGRAGRGDALAQVRLVGTGTDEAWEGPAAGGDPAEVSLRISDAAAWTAERAMRGDGPRGEVALLVVDVEAGACAWLTVPSSDESVVAAALAQGGEGGSPGTGAWAPPTPTESSVQALAAPPERGRNGKAARSAGSVQKLAVVAVPDVSARLFIDALDDRGVFVDRAVSLWHAMAMAWDPAGPAAGSRLSGQDVASSAPVTGIVVVDPVGRLVWSWSRAGELLAAGSLRLVQDRAGNDSALVVGKPEVGRLAADWLAWSLQIGIAPARVVCVGPSTAEQEGALSQQELGMSLGRLWPGATVDLAVHDDPIGATLRRLAGMEEEAPVPQDGRTTLVELSRRPGRAHRAVYRWASLAGLAAAAALVVVAWKSFAASGAGRHEQAKVHGGMVETAGKLAPPANDIEREKLNSQPAAYLETKVDAKRKTANPAAALDSAKPILQELDTLAVVLGSGAGSGIELDQLSLLNSNVTLVVAVPDTRTGEDLAHALTEVAGSHVRWGQPNWDSNRGGGKHPGKQLLTLYGTWETATGGTP